MTLKEFLIKAKFNTYASIGESGEVALEDGSKELIYEENGWKYRDRYFGSGKFIGEEIIWHSRKIVWAMNYYGGIISDRGMTKKLYEFLKKLLRQVKKSRPFRGPPKFIEVDWEYYDESRGTVDDFKGYEKTYYQKEQVYELNYHGGIIKK